MRIVGEAWHTIRLCIAGITGRMGGALAEEAVSQGFEIVGTIAGSGEPSIGKTLKEAGICNLAVSIVDSSNLEEAAKDADVYVSFATPTAELVNLPTVAKIGKRIVMGTTGFSDEQMENLKQVVGARVPAVFSPNYSLGVNVIFKLVKTLALLPSEYDFSVAELHHTGKKDAPSGTALKLGELISEARGYRTVVHGRQGISPRKPHELEVLSLRAGGVAGIHDLVIAGPHEMIRIEHLAFSRSVFAQGALVASEWINGIDAPGIYGMDDVLGERASMSMDRGGNAGVKE
ncbi:MAG: 4-hydroxy-tetrahydrodipicolinate reductase [archaeon]